LCSPGVAGTPCQADSDCNAGLRCWVGNVCSQVVPHGQGQSCYSDADCVTNLVCNQQICTTRLSGAGACTETQNCAPGWQCVPYLNFLGGQGKPGTCCVGPGTDPGNLGLNGCCNSLWLNANGTCGCSAWLGGCFQDSDCCTENEQSPDLTITYDIPYESSGMFCLQNLICQIQ
jgi:hypothetical protein